MTLSEQLAGKTAIVTGAGNGIGRGIAAVLAQRGAVVAITDIDHEAASETASLVAAQGGRALSLEVDVTRPVTLEEAVARVLSEWGQLDICVANAGVIGAEGFEERTHYVEADWDLTFDVNVKGMVHTADAVAPHMTERRSGRIVNIASQGGRKPRGSTTSGNDALSPYLVSKSAVIQWTHLLALQLAPYAINVNCVCPGTIWTPLWERLAMNSAHTQALRSGVEKSPREVFDEVARARNPLGRAQTPEEIGYATAFLASDDAAAITGQALNVNGGAIMN